MHVTPTLLVVSADVTDLLIKVATSHAGSHQQRRFSRCVSSDERDTETETDRQTDRERDRVRQREKQRDGERRWFVAAAGATYDSLRIQRP